MRLFQKTKRFYHFSFASVFFLVFFLSLSFVVSPFPASASDVVYDWVKTAGDIGIDNVYSTVTDSSGNVYVAGRFENMLDFDSSVGTDNHTSNGGRDIFLSKYDASGNYQWTKTFGGTGNDDPYSVSIDSDDNIYVSGGFQSTVDFDPSDDIDARTSMGNFDIFVCKYGNSGVYQWTKTFGNTGNDFPYSLTTDSNNNIYVSGYFLGTVDFDPTSNIDNHTSAGSYDAFVSKYDFTGAYQWTKTLGGTGNDQAWSVITDRLGNIYIGGWFSNTVDIDPTDGTDDRASAGGFDIFIQKYDDTGVYQWTKTFGGISDDVLYSLAADFHGNIYVAGLFQSVVDFDPTFGVDNYASTGSYDAFFSKYDTNGSYQWTRAFGGAVGNDQIFSITVDSFDNLYIAGGFNGTVDFDPTSNIDNHASAGGADIFLSKYNSSNVYQWTKTVGGSSGDRVWSVVTDPTGNIYIGGGFKSTVDFDPRSGVDNRTSAGDYDIFLSKFTLDSLSPSLSLSGSALINTPSHTYAATLSDTLSPILSLEYQIDSSLASWTPCTPDDGTFDEKNEDASCSLSNLSEGSHTIYFRTSDTSHNMSDPFSVSLTVDLTAPSSSLKQTISFKSKDNPIIKNSLNKESKNYVQEQKPKIQGTNKSAKNGTVSFYRKDGGTKKTLLGTAPIDSAGKWNFTLPKKKEQGTIDYRLVFTDQSGNVSRSSSAFQVTRDWKKPDFLTPLPNTIQRNQPISFTATDTRSGIDFYKVSFVGKGQNKHWIKQKTDTFTVPKHLPSGTYILTVRATDKAGNTKEVQKEYRVW